MDNETVETTTPLTLGRSLWAICRDTLPRIIEAHRAGDRALARLAPRVAAPRAARRTSTTSTAGGAVAVVPLTGVLTPRGSFLSYLFGGSMGGLVEFRDAFREALNSPDVGSIVLDIDSPGGLIDLVPETAQEIADARGAKPIIAVANTMAASGAYWIGAQADEFVITPSGSAGSIGVYMVHEDWSGFNEQQGIKPTYISAGKYKTEGNPDEPLADDALAAWQQEVDDLYTMFVNAVAAGRGVTAQQVRDGYGQGRTPRAVRAIEAGLVDRVDTIEGVIGGLLVPGSSGTAAARAGRMPAPRAEASATGGEPVVEEEPPAAAPHAVDADEPAGSAAPDATTDDEPPAASADAADEGGDEPAEQDAEARAAIAAVLTA
jgi:signal peptide peptidase SppA